MNIINTKQETYITLAPSLTGLISHYTYGTLYNIYTITNNYNHTSHKYIIYYTCIFVNMYNMKNVRISSDILDMLETSTFVETLRSPSIVPSINDPSTRDNSMS